MDTSLMSDIMMSAKSARFFQGRCLLLASYCNAQILVDHLFARTPLFHLYLELAIDLDVLKTKHEDFLVTPIR